MIDILLEITDKFIDLIFAILEKIYKNYKK